MDNSIRVKLERAQGEAHGYVTRRQAYELLDTAITEALTQLQDMERDHEAMDVLRENAGDLTYQVGSGYQWEIEPLIVDPAYTDPSDAILGKNGESE